MGWWNLWFWSGSCLQDLEATVESRSLRLLLTTLVTATHNFVCVYLAEYLIRVIASILSRFLYCSALYASGLLSCRR